VTCSATIVQSVAAPLLSGSSDEMAEAQNL
jgi:hypothetical protein